MARTSMPTPRPSFAKVPRSGVPIVIHNARARTEEGKTKPARSIRQATWQNWSSGLRQVANLSQTFSLDACRHGCMTELEKTELTEGRGRALWAHTSRAHEGYAERTMMRALAATRKRHAHRLATASANVTGTEFRNG
jgi:hypothetical protein